MANVIRKIIFTPLAPKPVGPYSQAVLVNNTLYLAGQIGMDPRTSKLVDGGVVAETKQALNNMGKVLEAAGVTFKNVVKCTVLMANMNDFAVMNDIYKEYFPENFPARSAYQVACLPKGAQIEIEAIAVVGNISDVQ